MARFRFLLSRRWAGLLILAILASLTCLFLARWQWHRREAKAERNAVVTANWNASPRPVAEVIPDLTGSLPRDRQWRPVRAVGRYLPQGTVLIRNHPLDGEPGYRVEVPFLTGGRVLYVDRGWVGIGGTAEDPDSVPAPPSGTVTVVARVRPAEPDSDKSAPTGQAQSITPSTWTDRLHRTTGVRAPVYTGTYAALARETPAAATTMPLLEEPVQDTGLHLSYTIQWCVFALMCLGMWVILARREADDLEGVERPVRVTPDRDEDIEDAQVEGMLGHSEQVGPAAGPRGAP